MAKTRKDLNEVFKFLGLDIEECHVNDLVIMKVHLNEFFSEEK